MVDLLITDARVVLPHGIARGSLTVVGELIERFIAEGEALPSAETIVGIEGAYLAPGLIDLHLHGSAGVDVQDATDDELDGLARWLAINGTTRFLPTLVPTGLESYRTATARISRWIGRHHVGASRPVGVHFEGPFVSSARCGALKAQFFLGSVERQEFFDVVGDAGLPASAKFLITLAPEIEGGLEVVRDAVARGFIVSLGHTEANLDVLNRALESGATHMTHLANAMSPIHHRSPGAVVWGLVSDGVTVDVIADLHHLHEAMLRLVFAAKGGRGVALISDAIAPTGCGDGTYEVWGEQIRVKHGKTSNALGSLAGSAITLFEAVANCIRLGVEAHEAVRMASQVPATIIGLQHETGSIGPGKRADLIVFDDSLVLSQAFVDGRRANAPPS